MRNATQAEIDQHTVWHVVVTFTNPNGKRKKPTVDIEGLSKQEAYDEALAQAKELYPQGKDHAVLEDECWDETHEGNTFFWDWKEAKAVGDEKFFEKLDKQLGANQEVVHIPFDGDAYPWFIGERHA